VRRTTKPSHFNKPLRNEMDDGPSPTVNSSSDGGPGGEPNPHQVASIDAEHRPNSEVQFG